MAQARPGILAGADGTLRCQWCEATPAYQHYHDNEWGFPVTDDRRLFEKLCLEGFQAGPELAHHPQQARGLPRAPSPSFDAERVARFGAARRRRACSATRASCAIAARSSRPSTTRGACSNCARSSARWRPMPGASSPTAASRPTPHHLARLEDDGHFARIGGDVEGPEEARLELRRPDDGLCLHAGDGAGQRSRRGLPCARTRAGGTREAPAALEAACGPATLRWFTRPWLSTLSSRTPKPHRRATCLSTSSASSSQRAVVVLGVAQRQRRGRRAG